MPRLEAAVDVPIDPNGAFELANGVGVERSAWDSDVAHRRWVRGATGPVDGAVVFTKTVAGRRFLFRYEHVFPGAQSSVRMIKGPATLASFAEAWRFTARPGGGTRVSVVQTFRYRGPAAVAASLGTAAARLRRTSLEARLAGFADACRARSNRDD